MFSYLSLETSSLCNRRCSGCIRNSHPNKDVTRPWFENYLMSMDMIEKILDECKEIDFSGGVCLSHYNEPLMDKRIGNIAKLVKSYGLFHPIFLNTNGDFLAPELAADLDGVLDLIIVSLYMDEPKKSERADWIRSLFHKTVAQVNTESEHIATHFNPNFDVKTLAKKHMGYPCHEPKLHLVINHRRQYLLCCDDVVGNFELGHFSALSISDYWFGAKHLQLMAALERSGGRCVHDYCFSCPRA